MSFSIEAKNELAQIPIESGEQATAELAAFIRTNGIVTMSFRDEMGLYFSTENNPTARRIYRLIKTLYQTEPQIQVIKNDLRRKNLYKLVLEDDEIVRYLLSDTWWPHLEDQQPIEEQMPLRYKTQKTAFVRAAFLGSGSITNPKKYYHLEIVVNSMQTAKWLCQIAEALGLKPGIMERKESLVFYLKGAEDISDLLTYMGASSSVLELENVRVIKDLRNNVNRLVNCETANINKTVHASMKQVEAIEYIQNHGGLSSLPAGLQELAQLRLNHPETPLKELGEMLAKPLGKSGVNHRLRRIVEYAKELKGE